MAEGNVFIVEFAKRPSSQEILLPADHIIAEGLELVSCIVRIPAFSVEGK